MKTQDFNWPRALKALMAAAESGNLTPREMYPTEVTALIALVAGAPLSGKPRLIAPGMHVSERYEDNPRDIAHQQHQRQQGFQISPPSRRRVCLFSRQLASDKTLQITLYTDYEWPDINPHCFQLRPANIVLALVRVKEHQGAQS